MHRKALAALLVSGAALFVVAAPHESGSARAGSALAQPPNSNASNAKGYELRLIRVGKTFQGLRYKVSSGESWLLVVDSYEKIPENGAVPPGDYDVQLITDDSAWMAFRIDRATGATWQLKNRQWVEIREPE